MDFEEKIKKLQDISDRLEDPNLSMSDGVKLYEEGVLLAKECYKQLNDIKGKINIIKQDLETFREESFE
ncbi:MAG: exodeoxyribonuclease VII small subunit [Clostridiales bacterium]|nr:exodeoxyribonuclease VII small subunit [Clostridiales bacterium]